MFKTIEAEQAKEQARKRAEQEITEKRNIAETLAAAQVRPLLHTSAIPAHMISQKTHTVRVSQIFDVISLRNLLATADPSTHHLRLLDQEVQALYAVADILQGSHEAKSDVVNGFLVGDGEIAGVSCSFLIISSSSCVVLEQDS